MKFRYLFFKFVQSYKNNLQVGGYFEPSNNNELAIMETAAYAAVNRCLMTPSADCSGAQNLWKKVECVDDEKVLSIVASMFLSILNQKDKLGKNFLFELIIAILRKKLTNCTRNTSNREEDSRQELTQEKITEIINYFLDFIKLINKNLDDIQNNTDEIFLNSEYSDSSRAGEYLKFLKQKNPKQKINILNKLDTTNEKLEATTNADKDNLGIINKFFEYNISSIKKISLSAFIEYLKADSNFQNIIRAHQEEINSELNAKLEVNFDINVPGIEKLIFIGTYNKVGNNYVVNPKAGFTKTEALKNIDDTDVAGVLDFGLQMDEINFLSNR